MESNVLPLSAADTAPQNEAVLVGGAPFARHFVRGLQRRYEVIPEWIRNLHPGDYVRGNDKDMMAVETSLQYGYPLEDSPGGFFVSGESRSNPDGDLLEMNDG